MAGQPEQLIAQCKCYAVVSRHFHKTARHVYRVAGCGDVVVASATKPRGNNYPEMRADFKSKSGCDR